MADLNPPIILPEALDGEHWRVLETSSLQGMAVNPQQHVATAALAVTEGIQQARYHELARIKYGEPAGFRSTQVGNFQRAIEELRLDLLLEARELKQGQRLDDLDWSRPPEFKELRDKVRFLAEAGWGAVNGANSTLKEQWSRVRDELARSDPSIVERLTRGVTEIKQAAERGEDARAERDALARDLADLTEPPAPPPPSATDRSLSREAQAKIAEALKPPPAPKPSFSSRKALVKKDPDSDEYEEIEDEDGEDEEEREGEAQLLRQLEALRGDPEKMAEALAAFDPAGRVGHGGAPKIGRMLIHDHLGGLQKIHTVRRTAGARDRGVLPVHMHRYTMDRAIFASRRAGGSVLIDGSGSMNWNPDHLEVMMKHLPLATVGIYHGSGIDWEMTSKIGITKLPVKVDQYWNMTEGEKNRIMKLNKERDDLIRSMKLTPRATWAHGAHGVDAASRWGHVNGTLCILGRDGKWGPMLHDRGSGNEVDVEALQWLASLKPPRIWISDGEVCGGMYAHLNLEALCRAICKRHKITRVRKVTEATRLLGFKIPELERLGV